MSLRVERIVVGPLATNCYVVQSASELAVIDPGADADSILAKITELGGVVRFVIDTHGHIDHIGANRPLVESTAAQLLIGELDAVMLMQPDKSLAFMLGSEVGPLTPTRLLRDGDRLRIGQDELLVVHTPGHTPGGICLIGDGLAFTGDTLFLDSIGRVDFPGGSEEQMMASLQRLQMVLRRDMMLYPGHGEPGSFGRALLINPFLR